MPERKRRNRRTMYFLGAALLASSLLNARLYSARRGISPSRSGDEVEAGSHDPAGDRLGEDRTVASNQKTKRSPTDCASERARVAEERTKLIKSMPTSAPAAALFKFGTPNSEGTAKVEADLRRLHLDPSDSASVECRGEVCRIVVLDVPSAANKTAQEIMASADFRSGLTAMNLSHPRLVTAVGSQSQLVEMPIFVRMRATP